MVCKVLFAGFCQVTTLLALNTFGQNGSINEYQKIELIDKRLEDLKRSLKSMQKQSSTQGNRYNSTTPPRPAQTPRLRPKEKSNRISTNSTSENIQIEPRRNEVRPKEEKSFDEDIKPTEELIKKISDRISKIQTITETEPPLEVDLDDNLPLEDQIDDNLPLEPEPIFIEENLDKAPPPIIVELSIPSSFNSKGDRNSAQKAYDTLVNKRKKKFLDNSKNHSADSSRSLENNEKSELPIRVSSVKPIFERNEKHVPYSERKFPRGQIPEIKQEVLSPSPTPTEEIRSPEGNRNSFNFYYGFSIPNLSEYKGDTIKFKDGQEFSFEFLRDYGYLSLGLGYSFKSFENERYSIPGYTSEISGDNTLHSLNVSVGLEPEVNDLIFLRARFSGGFAVRNHELLFDSGDQEEYSENSFYYAFLTGIGFKWSDYFHSLIYYKFDGAATTPHFGHASFHQFGLGFGLDF
tara:strand:+ start:156 stop:1544 length:1389 start_codon:yes stop_codon:yes gene_type:complete